MLAFPTAAAALLVGSASAAAAAVEKHHRELQTDFLRAMDKHSNHKRKKQRRKLDVKSFEAELYGNSKQSAELRKKVIKKSTFVKPGERKLNDNTYGYNANSNGYYNNGYYGNNGYETYAQQQAAEDYNNGYYQQHQDEYAYYNNDGSNNNQNNNNGQKQWKYYQDKDGVDDYFMYAGEWENEMGFDVTQFSLSYHRCAAVRQYDDDIAATEDSTSVFATKRFAVFRFCPAQTCMGWKEDDGDDFDCDEDYYGEDYCEYIEEYSEYYQVYQEYQQQNQYQQNCECEEEEQGGEQGDEQGDEGCQCNEQQNQNEDDDQYGARGEGCQYNYGEYLMEMDEYLELVMEYQEDRFQNYCQYCEQCMFEVYEQWLKNGGDNRKLSFEDFKTSEEHNQIRKLAEDEDHRQLGGYYGACPAYDTCSEYSKTCQNGEVDDYSDYFECTQVEKSNGMVAYIGPHCAEDGTTITLGVYSDEYCNEYIGNGVNIASFLGEDFDYLEDTLKVYYDSANGATLSQLKYINDENVCIPCAKGELMWESNDKNAYNDDDGNNYQNQDAEINEICENLYMVSARCDKHYRTYTSRSKQAKWAEAVAQEDLTCDFIDSVMMGNYNEMGMIDENKYNFRQQQAWMGNSMVAQEVGTAVAQVSGWQIFWLCFMIMAVVILAMWSVALHKSLSKCGPWRPRRGFNNRAASPNEVDLSRQNSGIVMGRSASNTSYYMT